jgi:GNAT superfamily N-acetyltransferase
MDIRHLNKKKLRELITSPDFAAWPDIPISAIRAQSQLNNPAAEVEDVLLLLATENGEMLGYLGVLPGWVSTPQGIVRLGWLSCIWTAPKARGKGIAAILVRSALEAWQGRIILTEFTEPAEALYHRIGSFMLLPPKLGIRVYFRSVLAKRLPEKKPWLAKLGPLLRRADEAINFIQDIRQMPLQKPVAAETDIQHPAVRSFMGEEAFLHYQWMLTQPWIREGEEAVESRRYAFSCVARQFRYFTFAVFLGNELKAFYILSLRDGELKIPYLKAGKEHLPKIARNILNVAFTYKAARLTSYHAQLNEILEKQHPGALLSRPAQRKYMLAKIVFETMEHGWETIIPTWQDGEGDCGFT